LSEGEDAQFGPIFLSCQLGRGEGKQCPMVLLTKADHPLILVCAGESIQKMEEVPWLRLRVRSAELA